MDQKFVQDLEYSDHEGQKCYIMYHGTTMTAAQSIKSNGFRHSSGGMLGPGVYVSRKVEKAKHYPLNPKPGEKLAILKLKVQVGKVKRIDRQGHPMQKTWHQQGYDTAWVPANCGMVPSGLEEDCVWDPGRMEVLDITENIQDYGVIYATSNKPSAQAMATLLNMMANTLNTTTNPATTLNMMANTLNTTTNPGTTLNMMANTLNTTTNPATTLNMMANTLNTTTNPPTMLNMMANPLRTAQLKMTMPRKRPLR